MSRKRTCIAIAVLTIAITLTSLPAYSSLVPQTIGFGGYNTNVPTQNYAGDAKIVLQITSVHNGGYDPSNFESYFGVHVLYSNDSAIKVGSDYTLLISQIGVTEFFTTTLAPTQLTTGTIIGINDYNLYGSTISVDIYSDDNSGNVWEQYITILSGGVGVVDSLQLNPESLLTSSPSISSMPSIYTENNLFNTPSTNFLTNNAGSQTTSTQNSNGMSDIIQNFNFPIPMGLDRYMPQEQNFANYW